MTSPVQVHGLMTSIYEFDKISLDKQDIIDEAFMLYQSMNETSNNSCEVHHTSVK
jgi:hypothetical protein